MRPAHLVLTACAILASSTALAGEAVWQLGVEDGANREFLPFSSKEFKVGREVMALPGFDLATHRFTFRVPAEAPLAARPAFPGGISGVGAANPSWISSEEIIWNETTGGPRVFSALLLPSLAWVSKPGRLNENVDPDAGPSPRRALRVAMPGDALGFVALPSEPPGPIPIRFTFQAVPGDNRITLTETSGWTYGRCWNWDVLRVENADATAPPNPVALELVPGTGFAEGSVFLLGSAPRLEVRARHLPPGATVGGTATLTDFFAGERRLGFSLAADATGHASATLDLPADHSGRLRVAVRLAGTTVQLGLDEIALETACIRPIAPLSEAEKDASFLGLCGLDQSIFDPYDDRAFVESRMAIYRRYRGLLQIHHERYHSLRWPYLEPVRGQRRWDFWDKLVADEVAAGVRLQLGLLGRPEWMSRELQPNTPFYWAGLYGMPEPAAWAGLCGAVATRYRGKIAEIELWNEPSAYSLFWPARSAADYATLIAAGSQAIKAAVPEMPVVAQTVWARQDDFIRELHRLGAWQHVDYHADHYWTDERLRDITAFLRKNGTGKGFYVNEAKSGREDKASDLDEAGRRRVGQTFFRNVLFGHAGGVLRNYEFLLFSPTDRGFGLLGPDLSPKLHFCVQKTLVNRTTGAQLVRFLTLQGGAIEAWLYRYAPGIRRQENGATTMLALVSPSGAPQRLRLPIARGDCTPTLVDLMDNPSALAAPGGILDLQLGADPVMILGVDEEVVLAQDAVAVSAPDEAAPGADLSATLRLRDRRPAILRARLPGGEAVDLRLDAAAPERTVTWRVAADTAEGQAAIGLTGTVGEGDEAVPLDQAFPLLITRAPLESNLLGDRPFAGPKPSLRTWVDSGGRSSNDGTAQAAVEVPPAGSGGIVTVAPMTVVPGRSYLVTARVSGTGECSGRVELRNAAGTIIHAEHRLLAARLTDQPTVLAQVLRLPPEATSLDLNLLLYKNTGRLSADAIRIERVRPGRPAHRAAFRATAAHLPPAAGPADLVAGLGQADLVCGGPAGGVRLAGYAGAADCSARARIGLSEGRLLIACEVVDDLDHADGDPERLWETDSLQIDVDPGTGIAGAATCQFSIGRSAGRSVVVRQSTIPSEDIVPGYDIGPAPAGVVAEVVREGTVTRYLLSIPATAIWPNLALSPGHELGFSLLVNDNDGKGRRGWIEWAGGVGDGRDASRFGSLTLE